ncbi:MAG TPA: beta-L-arabinofuranosidase domain-containing protein [Thermoanaerobaculia bacterium]|nr:beta-L-arabinofuranosidase domain-containing protein [Thermoanaerobaculia bacterium]
MARRGAWTRRGFLSAAASAGAAVSVGVWPARASAASPTPSQTDTGLISGLVRPFPLAQVRLGPGPFREARERNSEYLRSLPQDRLLHTFRVNAGLPSSAEPLGGWEKPDCELRGHFVGGHYLSACALTYAATGDEAFRSKANAMVEELAKCQKALGSGYLSAFPEELFDRLRNGVKVWAPFYTYDKILRGHLDVYLYCGNAQALATAEAMAAWVRNYTKGLSDAHMDRILTVEYGGMNAVLYDLSDVTGKEEYRDLAHRFDQKAFFDPLAARRDELTGLHANTQFPKVIGAARRYELTGEQRYRDIAEYFWREVTGLRCYATGGTSNGERWETPPGVLSTALSSSSAECCCAYNMLKLTRHLFAWTADPRAADYFERTYWNHRLGTQNPEDGTLMYYYPLASGYWKFYGSPLSAFWCCTGTGAEEFAKAGDSIYFHDDAGIFVNLFIPSEVRWAEKGLRLVQETRFPDEVRTTLRIEAERPVEMTLRLRVPWWATRGGTVKLNGAALPVFASPSSYLTLTRTWKAGDRVELELPMSLAVDPTPDDSSVQAVMYGPLVLAGRLGREGLTRTMTYGEYDCELKGDPIHAPEITADPKNAASWVEAVSSRGLAFRTKGQARNLDLVPLDRLFGERYAVYWRVRERPV